MFLIQILIITLKCIESERSKLDPLPEEKATVEQTYKRSTSEWKPSTALEKTDVVGTIEAIENAQTTSKIQSRDKSAWRKSNLNTSSGLTTTTTNTTDDVNESYARRIIRQRSRENNSTTPAPPPPSSATTANNSSPLHSIIEEDRRKNFIQKLGEQSANDRLQIYIRRPSDSPESIDCKLPSNSTTTTATTIEKPSTVAITSDHHSIYIRPNNNNNNDKPPSDCDASDILLSHNKTPNTPTRLRRSINNNNNNNASSFTTTTMLPSLLSTKLPPKHNDDDSTNKIEIDSDNIETPPSTRRRINNDNTTNNSKSSTSLTCRKLQTPRPLHKQTIADINTAAAAAASSSSTVVDSPSLTLTSAEIDADLSDIQFDRHSSTRRTRRYKRPTDYSSGNDDTNNKVTAAKLSDENKNDSLKMINSLQCNVNDDKDIRLQRWQDKLKSLDRDNNAAAAAIAAGDENVDNNDEDDDDDDESIAMVMSRVGKMGRNISSINKEDVREAIRNLKSPTETPDRVWSPPREIIIKEKSSTTVVPSKVSNHELNDEGFEETQSLVSDTPSHGKESTSSCNEQNDKKSSTISSKISSASNRVRPLRMTSSDSATTNTSSDSSKKKTISKSYVQSLLERNRQSLERSRSLRVANTQQQQPASMLHQRTMLPKRTSSLRKVDLPANGNGGSSSSSPSATAIATFNKRDVERSSSRTSLRSSRSSLNSAASANTVKNVPLKSATIPRSTSNVSTFGDHHHHHHQNKALNKKPFVSTSNYSSNVNGTTKTIRMPASRSSSSGSSVSATVRKPIPKQISNGSSNITTSKSFKENHSATTSPRKISRSNSDRISSPPLNSMAAKVTARLTSTQSQSMSTQQQQQMIVTSTPKTSSLRVSNFMRPTTASATKFTGPKGK